MKTFKLWMPFRLLALAMFLSLVSCSKAGQEPEIPGSDPNVKVPDPEGTITVNVINNGESVYLENLGRISMKDMKRLSGKSSKRTFRRGNSFLPGIQFNRHAESTGKTFEYGLKNMMRLPGIQYPNVQIHTRRSRERTEKLPE